MLYDLLKVYAATVCSSIPGCASGVSCRPSQTMWQYGSSLKTATSRPRTSSARPRMSSAVATPPVGLCGELRKIARARGVSFRNRFTSSRSGRNWFACRSGLNTARAPRRSMLGP